MARNKDRFEYVELSIPKKSALYRCLVADAEEKGQSLARTIVEILNGSRTVAGERSGEFQQRAKPEDLRREGAHVQKASVSPGEKKATKERHEPTSSFVLPGSDDDGEEVDEAPAFDLSGALASAALFDQFDM